MAAGQVLNGKTAKVYKSSTEVLHAKNWKFTDTVELKAYASSSTNGRKKRTAGVGDCSGTFEIMCHDGEPPNIVAGESLSLKLEVDTSNYITAEVMISQREIGADADTGDNVMFTYTFEGNGSVTYTGIALVD
jgi:hypothetical protein